MSDWMRFDLSEASIPALATACIVFAGSPQRTDGAFAEFRESFARIGRREPGIPERGAWRGSIGATGGQARMRPKNRIRRQDGSYTET
jgi:hypothetical protein